MVVVVRSALAALLVSASFGVALSCTLTTDTDGFSSGAPADASSSSSSSGSALDANTDGTTPSGCEGTPSCPARSCKELATKTPRPKSGVYTIDPDGTVGPSAAFRAYCEMEQDDGGWTLVMKVDGSSEELRFASSRWNENEPFRPESVDLDAQQTKNPGYGSMPVEAVRVGMRERNKGETIRWLVIPIQASSLRDLMTGDERRTSLGTDAWKGLIDDPTTQQRCNAEGFNLTRGKDGYLRIRLGIIFNDENDCQTPDSYIAVAGVEGTGNWATGAIGGRDGNAFAWLMVR